MLPSPPPQIPPSLQARPFRLDEAVALGLSRKVLRGRRFRRVRRGVYAEVSLPDGLATQADAVLLLLPGATLSHQTSASLRGLPVPSGDLVHVTVAPGGARPELAGVCVHQRAVGRVHLDGRPHTEPAQNFAELAEHLALVDLVVAGDAMIRRSMVSRDDLLRAAHSRARRRGRTVSTRAADLVRPRVDSPMETRVRLLLVLAGLPEPEPGHVIRDADGGWIGEVDLAYPEHRIAIEYHGDVHRRSRGQWRSDVTKTELLRDLGWTVTVLTSDDVTGRPDRTLERVRVALVDAGHPLVPATLDDEWRTHLAPAWARALVAGNG